MEANLQRYLKAGHTSISNDLLLHYRQLGLDNDDLVLYLEIQRLQDSGDQATPEVLARIMQVTSQSIIDRIKSLLKRQLVQIQGRNRQTESYDFTPMLNKLIAGKAVANSEVEATTLSTGASSRRQVLQTLEQEFGRMLSPMEMQTVGHWFDQDHFDPNMMLLAIQEAIANNARSLRYIEAILANWQRENLTSPQAVQMAKVKRRAVNYAPSKTAITSSNQAPQFKIPSGKIEDM